MADKIYQLTEEDGKQRLIQATNESAALLYAIGAKFQIKAANAVETAKLLGIGVVLEVVPDTRVPRKPRGSKAAEQAAAPEAAPSQDNLLDLQPKENAAEGHLAAADQAAPEQPTE